MTKHNIRQVLLVTGTLFSFLGMMPGEISAASSDYKIEVVGQPIKAGKEAPFSVRITHALDGKTISGTQIGDAKLHMVMGQMDMPAPVKFQEQEASGLYRFSGDLTMYGEWILDLSATPPGESTPVQTSLKFQVVK